MFSTAGEQLLRNNCTPVSSSNCPDLGILAVPNGCSQSYVTSSLAVAQVLEGLYRKTRLGDGAEATLAPIPPKYISIRVCVCIYMYVVCMCIFETCISLLISKTVNIAITEKQRSDGKAGWKVLILSIPMRWVYGNCAPA